MNTIPEKYLWLTAGIGFIYTGVGLIRPPYILRRVTEYVIDTTGYIVPLGIACILFGVVWVDFTAKGRWRNSKLSFTKAREIIQTFL